MPPEFRTIESAGDLDQFTTSQEQSQFLQSWRWGEFQRTVGNKPLRWGLYQDGSLVAVAQVFELTLPLGRRYWYCPRGPVVDARLPVAAYAATLEQSVRHLADAAVAAHAMFLRLEPPIRRFSGQLLRTALKDFRTRDSAAVQPADTRYLDLRLPAPKLLELMHQKTRYNIRLAERKGVWVRTAKAIGDFDVFAKLIAVTAARDQFTAHTHSYYREMFRVLQPAGCLDLFIAELGGAPIAANLVVYFGDTATYLHGASADQQREAMAPYLLQWAQLQAAQRRGCQWYDLWGVAPDGADPSHRWAGITRFKAGFGGQLTSYVGAVDLIFDSAWYSMYKLAQRLKFR
ncbi:MAG: peptidoglycan bridge formation glycyltransferase FemA/FemB family protein [Patescibacteria group bacterium]